MFHRGQLAVLCVLAAGLAACGSEGPGGGGSESYDSENVGEAVFELTSVPSGVGCVRITVAGNAKDFPLAVGATTASLNMTGLPLGSVSITGEAYQSSSGASCIVATPVYIADAASAVLKPGVITNLALTFRKNNAVNASVNFVGNVQAIAGQSTATYAIIDGSLYLWGKNTTNATNNTTPVSFSSITNAAELSTGPTNRASCATKADGTLWCWGENGYGQAGQAPSSIVATPTKVGTDTTWSMIAGGGNFTCAGQPTNRQVKCFGGNYAGMLGNGSLTDSSTPVTVNGVSGVRSLAAGYEFACAVDGFLSTRCWGFNGSGQLGDGTTTNRTTAVGTLAPSKQVATGGFHTCVAMVDGSVRCTGENASGQLGDGTTINRLSFTVVTGLSSVDRVVAGNSHTCALLNNGTVKCWGANATGQLGDGTLTQRTTPVPVSIPGPVIQLTAGDSHTCAVTDTRDIYCWGYNYGFGTLGDGSFIGSPIPVKVKLP